MKPYLSGRNRDIHRRRQANVFGKAKIYLEPFIAQLRVVWALRVPCPTWVKIMFTIFMLIMMIFPLLYPPLVVYTTVAVVQMLIERETGVEFSGWMDVLRPLKRFLSRSPSIQQAEEMRRLLGRYAVVASTAVSCIEYVRIVQDFFGDL